MKINALVFCGILAPVAYLAAAIIGGLLWPGYGHLSNSISDLVGSGAPNKWLLDPIFGLYNLFCLALGLGNFLIARSTLENSRRMSGWLARRSSCLRASSGS